MLCYFRRAPEDVPHMFEGVQTSGIADQSHEGAHGHDDVSHVSAGLRHCEGHEAASGAGALDDCRASATHRAHQAQILGYARQLLSGAV